MDMRRHLKHWLNDSELQEMGGAYEGVIAEVVEEQVRNRFTTQREVQPVIVFLDGWRIVPNIGMRRTLVEMFGPETDDWVERRIRIVRRRVARTSTDGEMRERYEKAVECLDTPASEPETTTSESKLTAADISWSGDDQLQR